MGSFKALLNGYRFNISEVGEDVDWKHLFPGTECLILFIAHAFAARVGINLFSSPIFPRPPLNSDGNIETTQQSVSPE